MKTLLPALALLLFSTSAFGSGITLNCFPTAGTNSITVGSLVDFIDGHGTGSFSCSDASLGSVVLSGVTINILNDYQFGNGTNGDPNDNSAGFTYTDGGSTWAVAQAGASTTTMNLGTGVTLFVIGNASSRLDTFTNTTSGGLGGTSYIEPATDAQTGALSGVFTIPVTAFIDAGGFSSGTSSTQVTVTYNYTAVGAPEPASMALAGCGLLLGIALLGRRRLVRN
jgi:hypothetical protein